MMGHQVHHRVLCPRADDEKMGPTSLSGMPEMQTQNRNNSAYPTMPEPGSLSDRRKKY